MLKDGIINISETDVRLGVTAAELTSFKGGGTVKTLYEPRTPRAFVSLIKALNEEGCEPFIIGKGSNVIISDGETERPVVSTSKLSDISFDGNYVTAGAGVLMHGLITETRRKGLGGLEFLSGVPCSVGGALKMNAGAFGAQIADYVANIDTLNCDYNTKEILVRNIDSANFGYRKGAEGIVLAATFRLSPSDSGKSEALTKGYLAQRAYKQPKFPSCGSVFKNASKPAGLLIEMCGLKGTRHCGAQISELHANFIVNLGNATAGDFLTLAELCENAVFDRFGVMLEREFDVL